MSMEEKTSDQQKVTEASDVVSFVELSRNEGIDIWLDGGWAVDALLGEQTCSHTDLDIVVQEKDVHKLRQLLEARGYKDVERDDTSDWNFVLGDDKGHEVDIHAVVLDENGNGVYGPKERDVIFPAASLTGEGKVNGIDVKCISAEYMVKFISPWLYKNRDKDFNDVSALCEKFKIALPDEYTKHKSI